MEAKKGENLLSPRPLGRPDTQARDIPAVMITFALVQ